MGRIAALLALATLASASSVAAQGTTLVDLDDFGPRQVKSQSFSLTSAQDVRIDAIGAESTSKTKWAASMWEKNGKTVPPWSGARPPSTVMRSGVSFLTSRSGTGCRRR